MDKIKVFIADDSAIIRKMVKSFISKGNELELVGEAPDGREAVKLCKQTRPDVVLLDVNMPVMNGIDAAKLLSYSLPDAILVALSGVDDIDMMREAMVAGAKDFIRKPFKAAEFNSKVKEIWNREQRRVVGSESHEEVKQKTIIVSGARQGSGATTLLTNAAVSLAVHSGKKVLVADCDFHNADLTAALGCEGGDGFKEALMNGDSSFTGIQSFIKETGFNLQLLAGPAIPEDPSVLDAKNLPTVLTELQNQYEVLCIDLPPFYNELWEQFIALEETLHIVVSNGPLDPRAAKKLLGYLRNKGFSDEKIKIIYNANKGEALEGPNGLAKSLGLETSMELPFDEKRVDFNHENGKPFVLEGSGPLQKGIEKFIDSIYQ